MADVIVLHEGSNIIELKDVTYFLKLRTIVPNSLILPNIFLTIAHVYDI